MHVLFLSRGNAGRGPMAEGLARQMFAAMRFESAGLAPGRLHPLAVAVMKEANLDISAHAPRAMAGLDLGAYDLVVLLGGGKDLADAAAKAKKRLQWPLMDPTDPPASEKELLARFRDTRMALTKHLKALGRVKDDVR